MYTTIIHEIMQFLGLDPIEYMIVDIVFGLSNHNQSWCYISKEKLAKEIGLTPRTVFTKLNKLIEQGLLIKHPETKHLKTSQLYYDLMKNNNKYKLKLIDYEKISQSMKCENISQDYEKISQDTMKNFHTDYEKISYNNKNNKESITNTINKEKEMFDVFRKQYKDLIGGKVLGLDTEFDNFKQYSKWKEVLPELLNAIQKEKKHRDRLAKEKKFVPEPKNLKYWIKEKRWETEYPEIKTQAQLDAEREQRYLEWEATK